MMGDNKGNSMVYVIIFITLLSIFSCGYMAISRYNMKSTLNTRSYMEARMTAKSMHRTFCQSLSRNGSPVMDCIRQSFESDCAQVREEFDRMMEQEEAARHHEEDTGGQDMDRDSSRDGDSRDRDSSQNENSSQEGDTSTDERWERYLNHALGDKVYVMKGMGGEEDGVEVEIRVKAKPLSGYVNVNTKVDCNGYHISMMADILFDNGAEVDSGSSYRNGAYGNNSYGNNSYGNSTCGNDAYGSRSREAGKRTCLQGDAVYRYYEEEDKPWKG